MPPKKRTTPNPGATPVTPPSEPVAGAPEKPKKAAAKRAKSVDAEVAPVTSAGASPSSENGAAPAPAKAKSAKRATSKAKGSVAEPTVTIDASVVAPVETELAIVTEVPVAPPPVAHHIVTDDEIRQHAYFLSLRRGGARDPLADWLEAERTLRAR